MRSIVIVFLGLTWGVPGTVAAQVDFELLPYAGVYLPSHKLLDHFQSEFWCNSCSLKQKKGLALGARLTRWWTSRMGAEVTLGYSPSGVSLVGAGTPDSSAHIITASVRVLGRVSPPRSPWLLRLGAGIGFVSRGGAAYDDTDGMSGVCGTTRIAGVVSAGTGFKFGRSGLALRLDAEDYVYSSGLYVNGEDPGCGGQCRGLYQLCNYFEHGPSGPPPSRFQNDLVLSLGIALVPRD
jgi:hypothetical protein